MNDAIPSRFNESRARQRAGRPAGRRLAYMRGINRQNNGMYRQ
ncbi:hypothetical protein [Trinickia mobilis]|nr:hypothetical protein [Trinickia mobilis]